MANGSMLTTFPELEAVNKNARIKNSFGKRCIGMGAGENSAAELVYKLTVPEGEQLTELTITVNALLAARPDKNPDWTGDEHTPYAKVSVSEDGLAYTDVKPGRVPGWAKPAWEITTTAAMQRSKHLHRTTPRI